ncbi:hypothetical protein [Piscinibacter sp.]|uniref:hypothetical protein n=1 Tax=Piscinibacter sp. TaxID=1903157 RepID=UPI0039E524A2
MPLQPSPTWYLYNAGDSEEVRLLDDDGRAEPALSGAARVLAELAEALHANAQPQRLRGPTSCRRGPSAGSAPTRTHEVGVQGARANEARR